MSATLKSDSAAVSENLFLGPIAARWRDAPEALLGMFHDGEDWVAVDQGTFRDRALRFAALLGDAGVSAGDIVLIIMRHGVDAYAVFIGTMMFGAIPSFLPHPSAKQDAALYWRQHREVFAHTKPAAIVVHEDFHDAVADAVANTGIVVLPAAEAGALQPLHVAELPANGSAGLLQHSSGTTGLKKGVQLSYESICLQLEAYGTALGLGAVAEPRVVSWLPLYHDMGLITSLLLPIWRGIPVLSIDPFEWTAQPSLFFEAIQDYKGTHAWLPNFAFLHQVRTARPSRKFNLESVVALVSCSEPCKPAAFDAFEARFADWGISAGKLQTCYAMAETVFAMTQSPVGTPVRRLDIDRGCVQALGAVSAPEADADKLTLLSNGPPVPGCEVRILRDGDFVSEREIGEVCISAPYLFNGYYNNPAATTAAFHGAWFRTGDLGFTDNGEVFVVGRLKDVIIVNGKNIFAHDVEAVVSRVAGVKPGRVVALGAYSEMVGSEQLVLVAEREDAATDRQDLVSRINNAVVDEVGVGCGDVQVVDQGWLVKTTSGKMSRSENLKKYLSVKNAR